MRITSIRGDPIGSARASPRRRRDR